MCTARNSKGATQWVLSISRISRLLAAWLGELSLLRYRLLWEKHWIMHPWRNGGLAAASNNNPHTPYHLRTDRWVHLDEVSQEVSTAYVGLIDTLGRFSLASVFCTISPNGKKWHFLPSLIWWGGGEGVRKVLLPLAKTNVQWQVDDTFEPEESAEGGYEVPCIDCQRRQQSSATLTMSYGVKRSFF